MAEGKNSRKNILYITCFYHLLYDQIVFGFLNNAPVNLEAQGVPMQKSPTMLIYSAITCLCFEGVYRGWFKLDPPRTAR